jgi:hypothetical protein
MKVKADFVVEGIALVALNAKRFVEDSIFLYQAKRRGSAAITAVIAIENVGRGRRMLNQILESTIDPTTRQFPVRPEIDRKAFLDCIKSRHEAGIRTGVVSLQFTATSPVDMSEFAKYAEELQQFPLGSEENLVALKKLKKSIEKVFNKTTTGFHVTRTIEQYVEPDAKCTVWNEPQNAPDQRVQDLIVNAANNYNFLTAQITGNDRLMTILRQKGVVHQLTQLPPLDFRSSP